MKKILSLLLCLVAFVATSKAQTVLWLDYCNGQYNTTQRAIAEAGEVEVAIHFTHDQLAKLAGNEVSQLSMAFPSTHPSAMTMWVRSDRDGENLREVQVASGIVSKWNTYTLDTPLPITGEEQDLWIGASFTQKYASNKFISMAGTTNAEGCYYRVDGKEWKSKASEDIGSLCIRMGVTGDNIPQHDMSLSRVSTAGLTYGIGDQVPFTARITNHGADDVVNPIVRCSVNGTVVTDVTLTETIKPNEFADVSFKVPTESVTAPGIVSFTFEALWADGVPDTHPENNTDGINVGLVVALHDLALTNVHPTARLIQLGTSLAVEGTIVNNNFVAVQNPQIAYSINGGTVTKKSISCKLSQGETFDFSLSIPTRSITEAGPVTVDLELLWRDGSEDVTPDDNKATVKAILTDSKPNRRMVCEEATGSWCGWCVRGIVGLHDMTEKYPEQFIGIAVHNGDEYAHNSYTSYLTGLGINGYPGSIINRQPGSVNPGFATLEATLKNMAPYAEVNVSCKADFSGSSYALRAEASPVIDIDNANYAVVFVITEDYLAGVQSNYYSGGAAGEMGGFEKLGDKVKVDYMDVARFVWPSGDHPETTAAAALPTVMQEGLTYTVQYNVPASSVTHKNIENLNCIAMIVDRATGEVVNAAKFEKRLEGINSVLAPKSESNDVYNLAGQRISPATANGISIQSGKKVLR